MSTRLLAALLVAAPRYADAQNALTPIQDGPKGVQPFPVVPVIPIVDTKPSDLIDKATYYIPGIVELQDLSRATQSIGELSVTPVPADIALPALPTDAPLERPSLFVSFILQAHAHAEARVRLYSMDALAADRLLPFPSYGDQQRRIVDNLITSLSMPDVPGRAHLDRWLAIRDAIGRMFEPHRYMTKSFYAGKPAAVGNYYCCEAIGPVPKPGPVGAIALGQFRCKAVSVLVLNKFDACSQSLSRFSTGVNPFDPKWADTLPLVSQFYRIGLARLMAAGENAIPRFQASLLLHDAGLERELERSATLIVLQKAQLAQSERKLAQLKAVFEVAVKAHAHASAQLKAAMLKAEEVSARILEGEKAVASLVKVAELADERAVAAEAEAAKPQAPVSGCNGPWRPDCSKVPAEQRKANEEFQRNLDKAIEAQSIASALRAAAASKLIAAMTRVSEVVTAIIDLAHAKLDESDCQQLVLQAHLKMKEDEFVYLQYEKLVVLARSETAMAVTRQTKLVDRRIELKKSILPPPAP